ncbi:MAG: SNF2-related protein [Dialister sp.]|nr:SNF2-related protein [Dialister sp.]MDY6115254.1 SNF2-related protein [Dialister sp.]
MTKEQAKTLVLSPQSVFTGAPFRFDRGEYSDRVIEYGAFIAKKYPYLNGIEGGWLPEEGSVGREDLDGIDELDEPEVTEENVAILKELIENAFAKNKSSISYQGKTYKLTGAFIEKVMGKDDVTDSTGGSADGEKPKKDRGNLISEENAESVGYEQANEQRRQKRREARFQKLGANLSMEQVLSGFKDDVVPFSYQKEGIRWMAQNWKAGYQGVLLADDMGLGKTMQVLGLISGVKNAYGEKDMNSVLVVAPVSLLANWESEFIHFVKEGVFEEIVPLYGNSFRDFKRGHDLRLDFSPVAKNRIVLTSYETLRNYDISFGCIDWSFMVLDEAQKIKNPVTLITNAVKSMKYDFAIAITGTPVENAWVDLWSIMDFVEPGRLRDLKNFCNTYQNQLKKLHGDMAGQEALGKKLEQELQPIFLRRQKTDYLEGLPHKEVIPKPVLMPPVQREAYEKIIAVAKKGKKKDILKVIAMLRDTSLCPHLTSYADSTFENMSVDVFFNMSARLKATFQVLVNIKARKEKVLIFVTSRKMQRILKRFLEKAFGISIQPPINGELIGLKRQQIVDAFNQKEGFAILILSAEAGGVGFNITAANHVIHLSRCWNPAKEDQATDRVYRIGQKKEVHVYLPIAQYEGGDSFDVKLNQLLQYKRSLSQSVIFPTADTEVDGQDMYNELVGWNNDMESGSACSTSSYWTIEDTDKVTGDVFERMVAKLYASIPGYAAEETKQTNNYGVDVVVETDQKSRRGLLVRCQQMMGASLSHDSVEAIYSAIPFYEKKLGYHFSGVVVTNALDFTSHDKERAAAAGVKLIARQDLTKLLERYPLEKDLLCCKKIRVVWDARAYGLRIFICEEP